MKTRLLTCLLLLFVAISSLDAQKHISKLIGTWRLTEFQYGERNRRTMPENIQRIKLITPTCFNWVEYDTKDNKIQNAAGGKIKFDGKNYNESIDYAEAGMLGYLGKEQKFEIKIVKDKMYLSGELSDNLKIEEVWVKLKQQQP